MPASFTKDPDAVVDYVIDWTDWLGSDTISSSTWAADTGITIDSSSNTTLKATVWLSGGTSGNTYEVTNRIVTAGGRTEDRVLRIVVLGAEGYCTREDVKNHLPGRNFDEEDQRGRTVVTEADLMFFVATIEDEVNALLQRLDFTVPVVQADSPHAYRVLGRANALGAAALAEEAWSTAKGEISERLESLSGRYDSLLSRIENHDIDLRDAEGGPVMIDAIADSGVLDHSTADQEPWFERTTKW